MLAAKHPVYIDNFVRFTKFLFNVINQSYNNNKVVIANPSKLAIFFTPQNYQFQHSLITWTQNTRRDINVLIHMMDVSRRNIRIKNT